MSTSTSAPTVRVLNRLLNGQLIIISPFSALTVGGNSTADLAGLEEWSANLALVHALHVATYFGDVTGNRKVDANDAAQLARYAAFADAELAGHELIDPMVLADISGNGRINAFDAGRVAQFVASGAVPEIPPLPKTTGAAAKQPNGPRVMSRRSRGPRTGSGNRFQSIAARRQQNRAQFR